MLKEKRENKREGKTISQWRFRGEWREAGLFIVPNTMGEVGISLGKKNFK